jgi:hypothetical protein
MKEPREQSKAIVAEMTYLRGRIITAYAQVEFFLADLSVKLNLNFPYKIVNRIKAVKKIAEQLEYAAYRDELHQVCNELLGYDEIRNYMAHGMVSVTTDLKGQHLIELRIYTRTNKQLFHGHRLETNLPRMRAAADHIVEYSQRAIMLFQRIYQERKLEE